jgi:hypothetical protein
VPCYPRGLEALESPIVEDDPQPYDGEHELARVRRLSIEAALDQALHDKRAVAEVADTVCVATGVHPRDGSPREVERPDRALPSAE